MLSPFKPNYKVRFVTGSSFYFIAFGNKRGILESDEKIARCGIFVKKEQECEVRTSPPDLVGYCSDMRIFASRKNAVSSLRSMTPCRNSLKKQTHYF